MTYLKTRRHLIQRSVSAAAALALLGAGILVTGCGGGSGDVGGSGNLGGPGPATSGRLALTIQWPEPGRLVPSASKSIRTMITSGKSVVGQSLIARPTAAPWKTVTTFDNLPAGSVTLTSTAYPNADGSGTAQATGSVPVSITADKQASLTETMKSTIDHLAITPASPGVNVGAILPLTMTAYNLQGEVVLTAPQKITWNSATPAQAVVNASGNVMGISAGTALITVQENESRKSASAMVTVNGVSQGPKSQPFRSVMDPTGKFVYVAELGKKAILQFRLGADGALLPTATPPISLAKPPYLMMLDPAPGSNGLYIFGADTAGAELYRFPIQADGTLASQPTFSIPTIRGPLAVACDPAGKFMYCVDHNDGIRQYRINADRSLTQIGPDFVGSGHQHFAGIVSQDGKYFYASAGQGGGIEHFRIQPDGSLDFIGHTDDFANGMSISPNAPYLYLNTNKGVQSYRINTDGSLDKVGAPQTFAQESFASAISPDGKNLYAVGDGPLDHEIAQYHINSDGTLTPHSPVTVPAGPSPTSVTISRDGKYVYITNSQGDTISQYRINPGGTLTPLSPSSIAG